MLFWLATEVNIYSREEIERKTRALATYGGITDVSRVNRLIERAWNLERETSLNGFVF
jgi:aconitate decarboxylase